MQSLREEAETIYRIAQTELNPERKTYVQNYTEIVARIEHKIKSILDKIETEIKNNISQAQEKHHALPCDSYDADTIAEVEYFGGRIEAMEEILLIINKISSGTAIYDGAKI